MLSNEKSENSLDKYDYAHKLRKLYEKGIPQTFCPICGWLIGGISNYKCQCTNAMETKSDKKKRV